jgi:hypothetical protein
MVIFDRRCNKTGASGGWGADERSDRKTKQKIKQNRTEQPGGALRCREMHGVAVLNSQCSYFYGGLGKIEGGEEEEADVPKSEETGPGPFAAAQATPCHPSKTVHAAVPGYRGGLVLLQRRAARCVLCVQVFRCSRAGSRAASQTRAGALEAVLSINPHTTHTARALVLAGAAVFSNGRRE